MSLYVDNIDYTQAVRTIREIILDTNPVQCFRVSGQGFLFSKDDDELVIGTDAYDFSIVGKLYDLTAKLRDKEAVISIMPDFVASEYCYNIKNFNWPDPIEDKMVMRNNYFSVEAIEKVMVEFFAYYTPYDAIPKFAQKIYNGLEYFNRRKLIMWVAYYLIDLKRMQYAAAAEMMRLSDPEGTICGIGGEFKNTDESITTKVGDVFSVTETTKEDGKGLEGFTSFWGDKYGYFTKLQLWIRDRFEKQFKDFSLRDDAMITQSFTLEKGWEGYAWIDTINLSKGSQDILQPDNRRVK